MNLKRGFRRIYYLVQTIWIIYVVAMMIYMTWSSAKWLRENEEFWASRIRDSCREKIRIDFKGILGSSEVSKQKYEALADCDKKYEADLRAISARSFWRESLDEEMKGFWSASNLLPLTGVLIAPLPIFLSIWGIVWTVKRTTTWVIRGFSDSE